MLLQREAGTGREMAIVVGDIHGDIEKAQAFLDYKPEELHIALGDYLDSFVEPYKQQLECLEMLMNSKAILLLGNCDFSRSFRHLFFTTIPPGPAL